MTFFGHHRLQYILMTFFSHYVYVLRNYALAPLPLSHGAPELTSGKIHVAERCC